MPSGFSVTPEQLDQVGGRVLNIRGQINDSLQQLHTQVGSVSSIWTGDAQANFQTLMDQWKTASEELSTSLEAIGSNLKKAAQAYAETDTAIGKAFGPA